MDNFVFWHYIVSILIGYLLGSSSMSYYISKIKKIDLKNNGSKNYGTSNTFALIGKKAGVAVFIHDFLKSMIAVVLIEFLFPTSMYASVIAGCFAVIGHIFPFYLKFDGGKGFASYIGLGFALFPLPTLVVLIIAMLAAFICDYMVVATCSFLITIPIIAILKGDWFVTILLILTSCIIAWKHKDNFVNLITKNGKEMKIKSAFSKKYKVRENAPTIKDTEMSK